MFDCFKVWKATIKCTRTERRFKVDFLENKASNEKFLFYIFDFFFRVESPPFRLYHQLPTTLYIIANLLSILRCIWSVCLNNNLSNIFINFTMFIKISSMDDIFYPSRLLVIWTIFVQSQ